MLVVAACCSGSALTRWCQRAVFVPQPAALLECYRDDQSPLTCVLATMYASERVIDGHQYGRPTDGIHLRSQHADYFWLSLPEPLSALLNCVRFEPPDEEEPLPDELLKLEPLDLLPELDPLPEPLPEPEALADPEPPEVLPMPPERPPVLARSLWTQAPSAR